MTISILPLSILIVEDHALLADGIRNLWTVSPLPGRGRRIEWTGRL